MPFMLDGYQLTRLPGRGAYSGYTPQRARAEAKTLDAVAESDYGITTEDLTLVLQAPVVGTAEFDAVQGRYLDENADGTPKTYIFKAPENTYEVLISSFTGHKERVDDVADLWADVRLELRVIRDIGIRFYLRTDISGVAGKPNNTEAATADKGCVGAGRLVCKDMTIARPPGPVTDITWIDMGGNAGNPLAEHWDLVGLWIGPQLEAGTIEADFRCRVTMTVFEPGPVPTNSWAGCFAYLWRGGVGWVKTLSDADPIARAVVMGGPERIAMPPAWRAMQETLGEDIAVLENDRIVCELWMREYGDWQPPPYVGDETLTRYAGRNVYCEGEGAEDPAAYCEVSGIQVKET